MTNQVLAKLNKSRPIITIIGGAGPDAAIDLQIKLSNSIKKKLDIRTDQDHYRVIVDNNSCLPSRDASLLKNNTSPLPFYISSAKKLEDMGGNILIISCNTAHAYFEDIQKSTKMKMINMIEETASFLYKYHKHTKQIGLLSTLATIQMGMYHKALRKYNMHIITPDTLYQNSVIQGIYGIKGGFIDDTQDLTEYHKNKLRDIYQQAVQTKVSIKDIKYPKNLLLGAIQDFEQRGINTIILGCTEIPLVIDRRKKIGNCILIDPTEILANSTIDHAIALENK